MVFGEFFSNNDWSLEPVDKDWLPPPVRIFYPSFFGVFLSSVLSFLLGLIQSEWIGHCRIYPSFIPLKTAGLLLQSALGHYLCEPCSAVHLSRKYSSLHSTIHLSASVFCHIITKHLRLGAIRRHACPCITLHTPCFTGVVCTGWIWWRWIMKCIRPGECSVSTHHFNLFLLRRFWRVYLTETAVACISLMDLFSFCSLKMFPVSWHWNLLSLLIVDSH